MTKPPLTLYLAAPRGFCAGVDRAIKIVEMALQKWGAPVYVRHEIVHNRHVVDDLRRRGAIFIEDPAEVPEGAVLVFSAHGGNLAVANQDVGAARVAGTGVEKGAAGEEKVESHRTVGGLP